MTRPLPTKSPPEIKKRESELVTETRCYKVITPLFGGGVEPGKADPVSVVRATEVRGHLRFWWRATRGGQYPSLKDLAIAEGSLWGNTEQSSLIKINMPHSSMQSLNTEPAYTVSKETRDGKIKYKTNASEKIAPYAAFPLQPDKTEQKQAGWKSESVVLDFEFSIELQFPNKNKDEVYAALWAWETFGGIGARTRRGFGSLQCIEINNEKVSPLSCNNTNEAIRKNLQFYVPNGTWPKGVPHLTQNILFKITKKQSNVFNAWLYLIKKLQNFRQFRYEKPQGLSLWPEANAIRQLYGVTSRFPDPDKENETINKFPRAVFGLPIPFHMPHDKGLPDNLILQGIEENGAEKNDRLASPLILRPIGCEDGAVGLAAILQWEPISDLDAPYTPPGGLILKNAPNDPTVDSELNPNEAANIPPLQGSPNVLEAFLNFLAK